MEYRNFGKLDWKVSALGFGAMRLPTSEPNRLSPKIEEPAAIRMMRHAIDHGVNYFDTAYVYHGGASEVVVGKALRDGYRQKVRIATKSPTFLVKSESDFDKYLNEQLVRLQTDYIDFYLLHGLSKKSWQETILKNNILTRAEAALRDGRIRYLGFSFHDEYPAFEQILNGYDHWTFCQIQYNYMDTENQAGRKGLHLAASKGLAVVIMEPLLGGRLANPPAPIKSLVEAAQPQRSPVEWALQWIWDQPEVSTVLSGMTTIEQVESNLAAASRSRIHSFDPAEQAVIQQLQQKYAERTPVPCTGCSYCMPCPSGVNIPRVFKIFNDAHLHDDFAGASFGYNGFMPAPERASACNGCQTCEQVCPQAIPISDWMPKIDSRLAAPRPA